MPLPPRAARTAIVPEHTAGGETRTMDQRPAQITDPKGRRIATAITWVYALGAASSFILLIFGQLGREAPTLPEILFSVLNVPLYPSLASSATLLLVTGALLRRKRAGLWAVAVLQVLGSLYSLAIVIMILSQRSLYLHGGEDLRLWLAIGANAISPLVGIAALILLRRVRAQFPGRLARGSWLLAAAVLVIGTAVSLLVSHVILLLTAGSGAFQWQVLLHGLLEAFGLRLPAPQLTRVPGWVPDLTGILLGLTIFAAAWVFLRSAHRRETWSAEHALRVRSLLADHGAQDSLGYFATRRDKAIVFGPGEEAAIAYSVVGGVALASGDPVGPKSAWDGAIDAFLDLCRRSGWLPAVISSGEDAAAAWTRHGMLATAMGDEAVLRTDRFDLARTDMTAVRRAANHARKASLTVAIRRHSALTPAEREQMVRLADQWRQGGDERGFSMALGRLGDPADGSCILVTAEDQDGQWQGLLSFVPWGRNGASLDVMRRSPSAPGGVTELMVSELLTRGSEVGVREVSLNFAMLRGVFAGSERVGASPLTRLGSAVLSRFEGRFQLESLYRSNDKYRPEWRPRYLLVSSVLTVPRTALAAGVLEGFVPWPRRALVDARPLGFSEDELARVREIDARRVATEDLAPRRSDQSRHRVRHMELLREAGMEPYPIGLSAPQAFAEVAARIAEGGSDAPLRAAGRVRRMRSFGGVVFVELIEGSETLQAILERGTVGPDSLRLWRRAVDTGDIVLFHGRAGTSRAGEPSLIVHRWQMASKALQPIPFGSFEDPEARLRRRSTDLIVHPRDAGLLRARSVVIRAVREHFQSAGYTEVETPILQAIHGGANARPFTTFINAYSADLTLRIAPELALKRLLVGGMGPIFEIGRNFRNEGADATHNPEFTVIEAYAPFSDYNGMRRITEAMIKQAARALYGHEVLPLHNVRTGEDLEGRPRSAQPADPAERLRALLGDVSAPWPVVRVLDAVSAAVGTEITLETDMDVLLGFAAEHGVHVADGMGPGAIIEELYGELVEERTIRPTFYVDFPRETSPLTGPHRSQPGLVERWDLVICGMEIGTAYSELADPLEQRRRFTEQSLKAAAGDVEAMQIDEDFLLALENAMPPAGGLGIGLDRLVMLLTDTSIREVLTFPFVRPERKG
ncbi:bifunctional lysylphosphatidylglycerol synthetase/lysine--tRNA ligase LysX [Brachybacterium sp. JHP9]|uniref:Lysine--tRNA ligase n=1 Tax=Brachybacterium equifaecis TaxID=2910770 RepID=A0ABT0R3T8_9MICO|nr:bifunctional lysylphosphatidylglycerol synthetase/lysine--tRNA ligase LysX [Brachybacterium equifaecis]MCL6424158.1 bifunctional lysylphosphatidylglycerol synthetase/lysine--tRNA ligase LysX [Brachybacterium equifaecis]